MENRRSALLRVAAGLMAGWQGGKAYQPPTTPAASSPEEQLTAKLQGSKEIPKFTAFYSRPLARPLWSELSRSDRRGIAKQLNTAYGMWGQTLPSDLSGRIGSQYIHKLACGGGTEPSTSLIRPGADIHGSPLFLPWHRAFILMHERKLGLLCGSKDFRLPIWDWDNSPQIPPRYVSDPAGAPVFAYSDWRSFRSDDQISSCYLQSWLVSTSYRDFFGDPQQGLIGRASQGPHAFIHMALGHNMANTDLAAQEPIFYAHHANVDRFWWHWAAEYPTLQPGKDYWKAQWFVLPDETGSLVRFEAADVLNPEHLGYSYSAADRPKVVGYMVAPIIGTAPNGPSASIAFTGSALSEVRRLQNLYGLYLKLTSPFSDIVLKTIIAVGDTVRDAPYLGQAWGAVLQHGVPLNIVIAADKLTPNTMYQLAIKSPANASQKPGLVRIGSINVFSSRGHSHLAGSSLNVACCLDAQALELLALSGGADLYSAEVASDTGVLNTPYERVKFEIKSVEVRVPLGLLGKFYDWMIQLVEHSSQLIL